MKQATLKGFASRFPHQDQQFSGICLLCPGQQAPGNRIPLSSQSLLLWFMPLHLPPYLWLLAMLPLQQACWPWTSVPPPQSVMCLQQFLWQFMLISLKDLSGKSVRVGRWHSCVSPACLIPYILLHPSRPFFCGLSSSVRISVGLIISAEHTNYFNISATENEISDWVGLLNPWSRSSLDFNF